MEILFEKIKDGVLGFKLNLCCFIFSVRAGILLFGFYNLITSAVALISVMTGSFPSLYMHAQQSIMDGEYVPSSCAFAYGSEICANVLLLCAVFRKDTILLRYFTYMGLAMAAGTVLVYTMVFDVLDLLSTVILVISLTCQIYVILLARSYIVEIQTEESIAYATKWVNDIKAIEYRTDEDNVVVIEPDTFIETPEDLSVREVIEIIEMSEDTNEAIDVKEDLPEVTNYTVETTEASTSKNPPTIIPSRYPFKFVAIKIPKEKTIEEEGTVDDANQENNVNDDSKGDTNKELNKSVSGEEVDKDSRKLPLLPKRSIFGRKKKRKDSAATTDESKKS